MCSRQNMRLFFQIGKGIQRGISADAAPVQVIPAGRHHGGIVTAQRQRRHHKGSLPLPAYRFHCPTQMGIGSHTAGHNNRGIGALLQRFIQFGSNPFRHSTGESSCNLRPGLFRQFCVFPAQALFCGMDMIDHRRFQTAEREIQRIIRNGG